MDGGRSRWSQQGKRNPKQASMAPPPPFGGFSLSKDLKHDRNSRGDGQTGGGGGASASNLMGRGNSLYNRSNLSPINSNGTINPAAIENMINKLLPMVTPSLAGISSEFNPDDGNQRLQMSGGIPDRGLSTVFQNNAPSQEGAPKARWTCDKCQYLNFPNRFNCNKCGKDKGGNTIIPQSSSKETPTPGGNGIQDWNCSKCQYLNFHHRSKCYKCGTIKTKESNGNAQANDQWTCKKCLSTNFDDRKTCRKCQGLRSTCDVASIGKRSDNNSNKGVGSSGAANSAGKNQASGNVASTSLATNTTTSSSKSNPKVLEDWVCARCQNLNYRHRKKCNRCQIARANSDGTSRGGNNNLPLDQFISGNNPSSRNNDQSLPLNSSNELLPAVVRKMAAEEIADKIVEGQVPIARGLFGDQMPEEAKRFAAQDIATKIVDGRDLGIDLLTPAQQQAIDEMRAMAAEGIAQKILQGGGSLNPTLLQNINNMIANPVLPTQGIIPQSLNLLPQIIPPLGVPGSVNLLPPVTNIIPPASVPPGLIQPLLGTNPNILPLLLPQENQLPPVSMIQQPSNMNNIDIVPNNPLNPILREQESNNTDSVLVSAAKSDKYSNYRRAKEAKAKKRGNHNALITPGTNNNNNNNTNESQGGSSKQKEVSEDKKNEKGDNIIDLVSSDSDGDDVIDLTDENIHLDKDDNVVVIQEECDENHKENSEEPRKEKDLSNPLFTLDDDSDVPMYTVEDSPVSCDDELYVSDDEGPIEPIQKIPMWTRSSDIGLLGLIPQVPRPEYGKLTNGVEYTDTEQEKARAFLARNKERCQSKERDRSKERVHNKTRDKSKERDGSKTREKSKEQDHSKTRGRSKERDSSKTRDISKENGRSRERRSSRDSARSRDRSEGKTLDQDTGGSDVTSWVDRYGRIRTLPDEKLKRKKRKVTTDELLGTLDEMGLLSAGTPEIKGPLKDPHVEKEAPPVVTIL